MIELLITFVCVLITIAFFTITERKVMASIQRRMGPNVVGFGGALQAFADGFKLIFKEAIIPAKSNKVLFIFSPVLIISIGLLVGAFIPFSAINYLVSVDFSLLVIYSILSLGVYGIIMAGGSSNSRYAFIGSMRSASQLISYEISMGLLLFLVIVLSGSVNITGIVSYQSSVGWLFKPLWPVVIALGVVVLAELNRVPFDLPEAEAEIVAGYNIEYSSMTFAFFFLAEYSNMIVWAFLIIFAFFGGGDGGLLAFVFKVLVVCFLYVAIRASYPRFRFDQLMEIGGDDILMVAFGLFIFVLGLVF